MVYHDEPFGYFSIDLPEFIEQFRGKSALAPMTVGDDIDGVSRATITNNAAVRSIRDSARRMGPRVHRRAAGSAETPRGSRTRPAPGPRADRIDRCCN